MSKAHHCKSSVHQISEAGPMKRLVQGPMKVIHWAGGCVSGDLPRVWLRLDGVGNLSVNPMRL